MRWIDGELSRVDVARTLLIGRRAALLDELMTLRRQPTAGGSAREAGGLPADEALAGRAGAGGGGDPASAPAVSPARLAEVSVRTTARLLLAAGVLLVVIAATVFTVADWARVGPLGRCVILLGVTGLVLAAPRLLVRRDLHATAESVAAIGLALTVADAYLARRLVPGGLASGPLAAAAGSAALAAGWAGDGAAVRLRGPRLAAVGLAQLPGPLVIAGLAGIIGRPGAPVAGPAALGLVLTAGADVLLAGRAERGGHRAESVAAAIAATSAWLGGVLVATIVLAVQAGRPGLPWLAAMVFTLAAIVGIAGPARSRSTAALAGPAAAISGALLAIGLSVPVTAIVPGSWGLLAVAATSVVVSAVALAAGRRATRRAGAGETTDAVEDGQACAATRTNLAAAGSAAMLVVTGLIVTPAALAGLVPPGRILAGWSGSAGGAYQGSWPGCRPGLAFRPRPLSWAWRPWRAGWRRRGCRRGSAGRSGPPG